MKRMHAMLQATGTMALAVSLATIAHAQATANQPSPAETQAASGGQSAAAPDAGEIVVTANKREESLNKVGLSVTAIGGEALAERRITSVQDIAAAVPGLKFAESGASTPIYTLRGVGFNESSLGVYPSVSVYIDQMPLPFPVLGLHAAFDLERVEALKGPQGTLFGQNATGGAINYVAAKPTSELHYGGDVSYGRFDQVDGNAYISGPLGGGFSGRIAVTGMHRDGWQKSLTRPGDRNAATKYIAGRASLAYQSGGLDVLATVNAWKDNSEPQAAQLIAIRPQIRPFVTAKERAAPFADGNPRLADWSTTSIFGNVVPRSDRKYIQGGLKASLDLGSVATLTSISSYQSLKLTDYIDLDGTAAQISNLGPVRSRIKSFNQELRIANQGSSAFRWVLGANYENSKTLEDQTLSYEDSTQNNPNALFITSTGSRVNQRFENYAFFGNVQYDVAEKLTLKAGVRYTKAEDKAAICGYSNGTGAVAALFNIIAANVTAPGVAFKPVGVGDCYVLNFQGIPGQVFRDSLKEDNVSWLAGVDYRATPDILMYANVSRGYKSGSYPTLHVSTFRSFIPVTQESVTAYEIGTKSAFADRRIRVNAAAFYYDYRDKQVRGKLVDPIFDILDTLLNVPKSRIYGFDADATLRVVPEVTLGGTVTYLKSKILSSGGVRYSGPNAYGLQQTFSGTELPFTPKWSWSLNASWRHEMADESAIFAGVDLRGQSSSVTALGGRGITFAPLAIRNISSTTLPFVIPSYTTVDGRLGYQFANNGPTVMIWGKNVFNKYYVTNANQYLDATVRFAGMPATYGATVSFKY